MGGARRPQGLLQGTWRGKEAPSMRWKGHGVGEPRRYKDCEAYGPGGCRNGGHTASEFAGVVGMAALT